MKLVTFATQRKKEKSAVKLRTEMGRQNKQSNTFYSDDRLDTNSAVSLSETNSLLAVVLRFAKEVAETILPALLIAFLVTHFLGERTIVYGQSMEPNLYPNQQLIIDKLSYRFHTPNRGDIIVINVRNSDIPYIKRVVGLPGEVLEVNNNRVYIDNKVLSESYISELTQGDFGPVTIPDGHIFVMGDNRGSSRDSRAIGTIPIDDVIARAWFRIWPLYDFGPLN
jgi:signal peptidase I